MEFIFIRKVVYRVVNKSIKQAEKYLKVGKDFAAAQRVIRMLIINRSSNILRQRTEKTLPRGHSIIGNVLNFLCFVFVGHLYGQLFILPDFRVSVILYATHNQ